MKIWKIPFFSPKTKIRNTILLVLPFEEISIRPELSSPARCRILEGYPERDGEVRSRNEGNPCV